MKLHAVHILMFEQRSVRDRVVAGRCSSADQRAIVAVSEVHERFFAGAPQQTCGAFRFELIPAHVGNANIALKPANGSREDAEPALLGRFFARFEKRLQAEADAQERDTGSDAFDKSFAYAKIIQRARGLPEVADSRKNNFICAAKSGRVANQFVLCADRSQGVLDGAEVPSAVIEDADHNNPLVDGNCFFSRLSFEQA